jgi:hypothetical protein
MKVGNQSKPSPRNPGWLTAAPHPKVPSGDPAHRRIDRRTDDPEGYAKPRLACNRRPGQRPARKGAFRIVNLGGLSVAFFNDGARGRSPGSIADAGPASWVPVGRSPVTTRRFRLPGVAHGRHKVEGAGTQFEGKSGGVPPWCPHMVALSARRCAIFRITTPFSGKPSNGLEPLTPSLPWRCSTN